jgi:Domain of unknown function (DUF6484)
MPTELLTPDAGEATDESPAPNALALGPIVGVIAELDASGRPYVAFPAAPDAPLAARTVVPLGREQVGREVVLLFEENDPSRPIVMGLLQPVEHAATAEVDGERVVLTAEREIVLRCGAASITLTRAGKILITGEYVLTRARGVNRVKGGSVQIN